MPGMFQLDPFQIARSVGTYTATYKYARVGSFRQTYGWPMYPASVPGYPWPHYSTWMYRTFNSTGDLTAILNNEESQMRYWYANRPLGSPVLPFPGDGFFVRGTSGTLGSIYGVTWTMGTASWPAAEGPGAWADHIPAPLRQSVVPASTGMPPGHVHPVEVNIEDAFDLISVVLTGT